MKNIVAIIVTYNVGNDFLNRIDTLKDKVNEIVVVDNGSNNETLKILDSIKDKIVLFKLNENKGIAYALNRGIEYTIDKGYQWILTLDHDSMVEAKMISNMIETYEGIDSETKEKIVMITPVHIEEKNYSNQYVIKDKSWEYVLTEITSGALTKASYYKENLYDENLFIDLVDHDFCLNINRQGYKIIQVKSAVLIHNLGDSIKKKMLGVTVTPTNHSSVRRYYMSRNRFYIWNKYKNEFPQWVSKDKKRFVSELIKVILFEEKKTEKIKMTIRGIKDFKNGKVGKLSNNNK